MSVRIATAVLLIIVPLAFNIVFFLLQKRFEYPDILRKPTGEILERFQAGGSRLVGLWYAFAFTALLFIPVAVLLPRVLGHENPAWFGLTAAIGVLAGLVQVLGLLRWPFLVPYLARTYTAPETTQSGRDAAGVVFQAFHSYLGVAVGEHLGYLFTSAWTALVAYWLALNTALPWFGWLGFIPALGIFLGVFEPAGWKPAGAINAIAYILWSLWLIDLGVILLV